MAEKLKDFTFGRMRSNGASDYEEYLEIPAGPDGPEPGDKGPIWKLTSEDSSSGTASIRSMQTTIANIAKKRGLKIRTNVIVEDEEEFLVLQAYVPEEDEE